MELLEQLMQHYCLCWATKGGSELGTWLYFCWFDLEMGDLFLCKECRMCLGRTGHRLCVFMSTRRKLAVPSPCFLSMETRRTVQISQVDRHWRTSSALRSPVAFPRLEGKRPWESKAVILLKVATVCLVNHLITCLLDVKHTFSCVSPANPCSCRSNFSLASFFLFVNV